MAYLPQMDQTGAVVALIAAVLDARDTGDVGRAREMGFRAGAAMAEDVSDWITTAAFVGAALAELAAEAIGISPEEVLLAVTAAGSTGEDQQFGAEDQ